VNSRLPIVCRKLRTKQAFGAIAPGPVDWREGDSTTDVFWCLKTMETWGPDDEFAHARRCVSGRACFEAPEAEGEAIT
jgi:hypothetical protein